MPPLSSHVVSVDNDVTGNLWTINDLNYLAQIIAVIAIGQAEHAARIIHQLESAEPAISIKDLYKGARNQLRIKGDTDTQKEVSMYHRDGFLFECISWIVAQKQANHRTLLKDPHISSTTQGLDGLMIELDPNDPIVLQVTIFEDKCTENPRKKFRDEVMPTFIDHHTNVRSRELIANSISLLKQTGMNGTAATHAASRVVDHRYRRYRAALTVDGSIQKPNAMKKLFKNFCDLDNLNQSQRVGAAFEITGDLRDWFQQLADLVIESLYEFEKNV